MFNHAHAAEAGYFATLHRKKINRIERRLNERCARSLELAIGSGGVWSNKHLRAINTVFHAVDLLRTKGHDAAVKYTEAASRAAKCGHPATGTIDALRTIVKARG